MAIYEATRRALNSQFSVGGANKVLQYAIENGQISKEDAKIIKSALRF